MKIKLDVNSCYECYYSTNNAIEHNDPFTSGPATIIWYCNSIKRKGDRYIKNEEIIDKNCPYKKENK